MKNQKKESSVLVIHKINEIEVLRRKAYEQYKKGNSEKCKKLLGEMQREQRHIDLFKGSNPSFIDRKEIDPEIFFKDFIEYPFVEYLDDIDPPDNFALVPKKPSPPKNSGEIELPLPEKKNEIEE